MDNNISSIVIRVNLVSIIIKIKKNMKGKLTVSMLAGVALWSVQPVEACTRAVYIGPDQMVITGRTMDWKEDIKSNIYVFPRGIKRDGHNKEKTISWTSKYGSVIATGYDIGTCDGMNEKGLVASMLFLPEMIYSLPVCQTDRNRLCIWPLPMKPVIRLFWNIWMGN